MFGHDHIGFGRSTGERAIVKKIDEYVLPLLAHVKKVKNDFNNEVPISIMGHSMGGLITVHAAMAEPDLFKSIVLMAPSSFILWSPKTRRMCCRQSRVVGTRRQAMPRKLNK